MPRSRGLIAEGAVGVFWVALAFISATVLVSFVSSPSPSPVVVPLPAPRPTAKPPIRPPLTDVPRAPASPLTDVRTPTPYTPPVHENNPFVGPPRCPKCAGTVPCNRKGPRPLGYIVPRDAEWPPPDRCSSLGLEGLCSVLKKTALDRSVLVAVANSKAPGLDTFIENVMKRAEIRNFMIVALDQVLADRLERDGVPYYLRPNKAQGNHKVSAQKFGIVRDFLDVGCGVLLTDTDVVYLKNPFDYLAHDSDVETMVDGWDWMSAFGFTEPVDDPTLGVRKRAYSSRVQAFNSGLWYIAPTKAGRRLMDILAYRMREEDTWDQAAYFMELMFPSRDAHLAYGGTVRVLSPLCFMNSKTMMVIIRPYLMNFSSPDEKLAAAREHGPVALHANYHQDKPYKMKQAEDLWLKGIADGLDHCECPPGVEFCGCAKEAIPIPILEREWQHSINDGYASTSQFVNAKAALGNGPTNRTSRVDPLDLALQGGRVVEHDSVLRPWGGQLPETNTHELHFVSPVGCKAACTIESEEVLLVVGVGFSTELIDFMVAQLTRLALTKKSLLLAPEGYRTDSIAVVYSPSKWSLIADILASGKSVFVAEADVVLISDPFSNLYRDSDVEAASDGWDDISAYGYDHVTDDRIMGWSRYCHGVRLASRDPGMVYLRHTVQALELATRMARLRGNEVYDFNRLLFEPSHDVYQSTGVVPRTANYLCYANSKTVWKHLWDKRSAVVPTAVHLQYHVVDEKVARAKAVLNAFLHGRRDELLQWNIRRGEAGKGTRRPDGCTVTPLPQLGKEGSALAARNRTWSWAGSTPLHFHPDGSLTHPWGKGSWVELPRKGFFRMLATLAGTKHLLTFETPDMFISERCTDGDVVLGRAVIT